MAYSFFDELRFEGGVVTLDAQDNLKAGEYIELVNLDLEDIYSAKVREGTQELYAETHAYSVDRVIEYEYIDTNVRYNKRLKLQNGTIYDSDGTQLATGFGAQIDYEVFNNKLYVIGNGQYMEYDGTTMVAVTDPDSDPDNILPEVAKCQFIEQRGNRLFLSGNPDLPNFLYFSEVDKPYLFDGTLGNPFRAVTDDGEVITGMREYNGYLVVFKRSSIFAWAGYDPLLDVSFKRIRAHSGCVSFRTIAYMGNMLVFRGVNGVYALQGLYEDAMSTVVLSTNISPTMRAASRANTLRNSFLDASVGVFYNNKYILALPTTGTNENDTIAVFHYNVYTASGYEIMPWTFYEGLDIKDALVTIDNQLIFGHNEDGAIDVFNHELWYDRVNTNYTNFKLKTRPYSMGEAFYIKKFRRAAMLVDNEEFTGSKINVVSIVDGKEINPVTGGTSSTLRWDDEDQAWESSKWYFEGVTTYPINVKEKGLRLTFQVESTELTARMTIYGFGVEYKMKKPKKEA